jgi:hypothetical protein
VNWSNSNTTNWDLRLKEELKESFEGTKGGCLHANTFGSLVDVFVHDIDQVAFDFFDSFLNFSVT